MIFVPPVSYLVVQAWLATFAYTVPLSGWYFVIGGLVPLVITALTVGAVAITAARSNPVRYLRQD